MKMFLSRVCLLLSIVSVHYVKAIDYSDLPLDDTVSTLFRGDLSPSNAAYTISRPGVYKLTSAKTASGVPNISITANNVTLDLGSNTLTGGTNGIQIAGNNVTVKNGTVFGMTQSGVLVQGNSCRIENCDVVSSGLGITLENVHQCVVEKCRVRDVTQAGVSLVSSYTNYIHDCSVLGVESAGNAYGFVAANGGSNVFDSCLVHDIKTRAQSIVDTAGWNGSAVGGFLLKGELGSHVIGCSIDSVLAPADYTNQSYGIGVVPGVTLTSADSLFTVTQSSYAEGQVNSVAWLVSGDMKYLASGGRPYDDVSNQVKIYRFDEATSSLLSITQSAYPSGLVTSVAWLVSGSKKYLATGEDPLGIASGARVRIYDFDEATSSLLSVTHSSYADGRVYSVAWLILGDKKYLASGGGIGYPGSNEISLYEFDEATSSLLSVTHSPYAEGDVRSVAWLVSGNKKYLASGGFPIGGIANRVKIYEFDEATSSLLSVTHSSYAENAVLSVAWLVSGDKKYLISGGAGGINELKVYEFDEATSSLLSITHSPYADSYINSIACLVSGDKKYIAAGGFGTHEISLYEFDEATSSLLSITHNSDAEGEVTSVAWLISGSSTYLASGGLPDNPSDNKVKIFRFDSGQQQTQQKCLFINNSMSGVHSSANSLARDGGVVNGIGLSLSTTLNYVANNTVYDCDISFDGVPTQFIDSQANARGVDNIDTNLTTLDQIEVASDTLTLVENKIDLVNNNSLSIQTIVDNNYACSYTPITVATTIATAGAYRLANTISNGDLSITATGVTFCLDGRAIYNGSLIISGDRVHAYDGLIRGTGGSGVVLRGDKCTLNDIRVSNCRTGFELIGADQNNLEHCQALNCTREGYLLTNASYNTLSGCQATGIVGTGTVTGIKTTGGIGNEIADCSINRVQSTASGDAYGLWGVTESRSQIHDNNINDVSAVAGSAKGLALDENMWLQNALSFQASYSTLVNSLIRTVDWLRVKPGLAYLICSDDNASSTLRIFRFVEQNAFDLVFEQKFTVALDSVSWFQAFENTYALVVTRGNAATDIFIYLFDQVTETLLPLPAASYNYDTGSNNPRNGKALPYDDTVYVAVGGDPVSGPEVRILNFNGKQLTLIAQQEENTNVYRLDWYKTGTRVFLAMAREGAPQIKVYEFLPQQSPRLISRGTITAVSADGVRWLKYDNNSYLAYSTITNPSIFVAAFNPDAGTPLSKIAEFSGISGRSASPDWLVSGTTIYLADPERKESTTNFVRILTFDPAANTLTSFRDIPLTTNVIAPVAAWYTGVQGRVYLAAGLGNVAANRVTLELYGFDLIGSTTSVVQNNSVSNIDGMGIAVNELSNPVLNNEVYNATTPYYPWAPYRFDPSNEIISG